MRIDGVRVIGERINPTGKKRFQQALLENDMEYILDVAVQQEDAGADILDVNVGYPGVDEVEMLPRVVKKLQSVVSLPLQLDSSNPDALEAGLRVYNGKAAVNSVNGNAEVMARVLPIVKKYGAAVVGLTLDENGIPQTARGTRRHRGAHPGGRAPYGIPREDVWIDCLTLTVSAQQEQARETLARRARGARAPRAADGARRVEHLLRPAEPRARDAELSDAGDGLRPDAADHQPEPDRDARRRRGAPGALGRGRGLGPVYRALCRAAGRARRQPKPGGRERSPCSRPSCAA